MFIDTYSITPKAVIFYVILKEIIECRGIFSLFGLVLKFTFFPKRLPEFFGTPKNISHNYVDCYFRKNEIEVNRRIIYTKEKDLTKDSSSVSKLVQKIYVYMYLCLCSHLAVYVFFRTYDVYIHRYICVYVRCV